MNVATSLNKKYIPYTIVMLTSLCINNPVHIDAYILNSELTDDDISGIREHLSKYDINIIPLNIDKGMFSDRFPQTPEWTLEAYYRLFLCDLLPEAVERIFYFDVDLIINKNLEELYNSDFEGNDALVCVDSLGASGYEDLGAKQQEMLKPMAEKGYKYFNSGVMLFNTAGLRNKYCFDKYLEYIKEWNYEMYAPDQDILNYAHLGKVKYIDPYKYDLFALIAHNQNITYKDVKENTYIIHFAGTKPWQSGRIHYDIEQLWWDYAKETNIYHELMDGFLKDYLFDATVENTLYSQLDKIDECKESLSKIMTLNQKLLAGIAG